LVSVLAVVSLYFTGIFLLHWASGPQGMDPAWIPLWACFAIVGFPTAVLGAILLVFAIMRLKSIHPLHNAATEALKENVQWATRPTK
jgi:hypothetical protein